MKLRDLSEARVVYKPGWERTVKPTEHYLSKSADPFRYWTIDDMVPMMTKIAGYSAKGIIRKFRLNESDFDDLVQSGLTRAVEKLKQLEASARRIHGSTLRSIINQNMWGWMRQSDPRIRKPSRVLRARPLPASSPSRI